MPTLAHNPKNSVVLKSVVIVIIIHNIFNLRDTVQVATGITCLLPEIFLLAVVKRADDPEHHFNNR